MWRGCDVVDNAESSGEGAWQGARMLGQREVLQSCRTREPLEGIHCLGHLPLDVNSE